MILDEILFHRRKLLAEEKNRVSLSSLEKEINNLDKTRDFKKALKINGMSLIAEIKKASPSKGVINENLIPEVLATDYERGGARAISVLTEQKYFRGHPQYLKQVRERVALPVLRKDFIFDPYQVMESRVLGADAILLIASILSNLELKELLSLAKELDLFCLVEVHDRKELEKSLENQAQIIGINNRNLKDFTVDINTTLNLLPHIPEDVVVVSESGIHHFDQVNLLAQNGVDAILVGEALSGSSDINVALRRLMGEQS